MPTLDEAIAHAREVASEQKRRSGACVTNDSECDKFSNCIKCAEEHEQLAELLEELKARREADRISDSKPFDVLLVQRYNKALDDFVEKLCKAFDETTLNDDGYYPNNVVRSIAEQLKAGGTE